MSSSTKSFLTAAEKTSSRGSCSADARRVSPKVPLPSPSLRSTERTPGRSDRQALTRFLVATEGAETIADLMRAWAAIPDLAEEHPDFLEARIFSRAARDGDWPGSDPPLNQKVVFVDGVRQG